MPLTVSATSRPTVTAGQNIVETGSSYDSATNHALYITGGTYSGTDIILSSNTNSRYGANVTNSGALTLTSGTVTTGGIGISITNTSSVILNQVNITTGTFGYAYGVNVMNSSTATINGGTISTIGRDASAIRVSNSSAFSGSNFKLTTSGTGGHGIYLASGGQATVRNFDIETNEYSAYGLLVDGYATDVGAQPTDTTATLRATSGTITTYGDYAYGAYLGGSGSNALYLTDVKIQTSGVYADGLRVSGGIDGDKIAELTEVTIDAPNAAAISVNRTVAHNVPSRIENIQGWSGIYNITVADSTLSGSQALYVASTRTGINAAGDEETFDVPVDFNLIMTTSTLNGEVFVGTGDIKAAVNLNDSALNGDLINNGTSTLTVNLNNSVMTGISTINDNATTNLTIRNNSNWNMTGKSKLTTLHGANGGSITIDNVQGEDLVVTSGITGQTKLNLTLSSSVGGQQEIWVVVDETNAMSDSAFTLGHEVSYGMYSYELVNETNGAWLVYTGSGTPPVNPPVVPPVVPPTAPIISPEGDAVLNTAASVSGFWFTQLDNLVKRMGELRYNHSSSATTLTGKDDKDVTLSSEQLLENIWIRAYRRVEQLVRLCGIRRK